MNKINIEAKRDFLERLATASPIKAVAELIWNGLDAGSNQVSVRLEANALGGLDAIPVGDAGHGINHGHVQALFGGLGDSWKKQKVRQNGRALHGRNGQGRFKAFALGNRVEWNTVFDSAEGHRRYQVVGRADALTDIEFSDPAPADGESTGTEVVVTGIQKSLGSLLQDGARVELAKLFAAYLSQYPDVHLDYDGVRVDPSSLQVEKMELPLEDVALADGRTARAVVTCRPSRTPILRACPETMRGTATRGFGAGRGVTKPHSRMALWLRNDEASVPKKLSPNGFLRKRPAGFVARRAEVHEGHPPFSRLAIRPFPQKQCPSEFPDRL